MILSSQCNRLISVIYVIWKITLRKVVDVLKLAFFYEAWRALLELSN